MHTTQQTKLRVEGMTCPSCARRIELALGDLDGIHKVQVQVREGTVVVEHDAPEPSPGQIVKALQSAGYESHYEPN